MWWKIWNFIYAKQRNVPEELKGILGYDDVYTWTVLDTESKLILSWLVGTRSAECAELFMCYVAKRLAHRTQLTTGHHSYYLEATEKAFGGEIDYAMLIKLYGIQFGRR